MGRKTNSNSLRLKKTNKDYIHCVYGDILYAQIFKKCYKIQKAYRENFKTIHVPCPQVSLAGAYKKSKVAVAYLDPRSRAFLSEKFSVKSRFLKFYNLYRKKKQKKRAFVYTPKSSPYPPYMYTGATLGFSRPLSVEGDTRYSFPSLYPQKKGGFAYISPQRDLFFPLSKDKRTSVYKYQNPCGVSGLSIHSRHPRLFLYRHKKKNKKDTTQNHIYKHLLQNLYTPKHKKVLYRDVQNVQLPYSTPVYKYKSLILASLQGYVNKLQFDLYKYGVFLGLCSSTQSQNRFFGKNAPLFYGDLFKQPKPIKFKKNNKGRIYKPSLSIPGFSPPYPVGMFRNGNMIKAIGLKGQQIKGGKISKNFKNRRVQNGPYQNESYKFVQNPLKSAPLYLQNLSLSFKSLWGNTVSTEFYKVPSEKACALFLAHYVSYFLERKVLFRHIKRELYKSVSSTRGFPLSRRKTRSFHRGVHRPVPIGIRICCSGRVGSRSKKAQRSRKDTYMWGQTGLHVFSNMLDYAKTKAETRFGTIGIQVWVCYGKR